MSLRKGSFQIILAGLSLSLIWLIYVLGRNFIPRNDSKLFACIPDESSLVVVMDARELMKQSVLDVFIEHPENDLLKRIKETSKQRIKKLKPTKSAGVHYAGKVAYFKVTLKKTDYSGFLLHLSDEDAFLKRFRHSNYLPFCQDGVGLLLSKSPENSTKSSAEFAQHLLKGQSTIFKTKLSSTQPEGLARIIWANKVNNWSGLIHHADLTLFIKDNKMRVEGELNFSNEEFLHRHMPGLPTNGFQFSTSLIPSMPASWQSWITRLAGQPFPEIRSLCLNYRGVNVSIGPPLLVEPDFDLIVEFNQMVQGSAWLNNPMLQSIPGYRFDGNTCHIGPSTYAFRQLKPNRIFLGKTQDPSILSDDDEHVLKMSGSVEELLTYRGNRLVGIVIDALPGMRQLKQLAASGTEIDLRLSRLQKGGAGLSLTCSVDRKNVFWNELLKLLLTLE
jgi:hypothetical protein